MKTIKKCFVTNYLNLWLILVFCIKNCITINENSHNLIKRMSLETCLGQFDVHRNTIIRTEESQAIGGKYLQGIGLNNLEECERLCCETDHCDVYIFEEKDEGYCYLFECGTPENFHCKFTRHANYTSAVYTPIKRATIPPPSIKSSSIITHPQSSSQHNSAGIVPLQSSPSIKSLSQHELELTNLKQRPLSSSSDLNVQHDIKLTTTLLNSSTGSNGGNVNNIISEDGAAVAGIHLNEQVTTPKNSHPNGSTCGRFQFQCHSGECIAVYNACDGIPQCEDGSDEGPECPTSTGLDSRPINFNSNKLSEISSNYRIPSGNSVALSKQTGQLLPRQYQQQVIQNPVINNREDPMSAPSVWMGQKDPNTQGILDKGNHIFSRKGGLQLSTNNNLGPQYGNTIQNVYNPLQRAMFIQNDLQGDYQSPIIQPQDHMVPPPNVNWQQISQQSLIPPYVIAVNGQPVPQIKSMQQSLIEQQNVQSSQINNVQAKSNNGESIKINKDHSETNTMDDMKATNKKDHHSHHHQNNNNNSDEDGDDYSYEDKSTEPPKKKQRKHKKLSSSKDKPKETNEKNAHETEKHNDSPVHQRYKMIKEDLEMEFLDHDGQSERPGGAVLSLTLGLIVTAALAILIGCRMRTVGRRMRRIGGKTPYAHDADFLVNGMYL